MVMITKTEDNNLNKNTERPAKKREEQIWNRVGNTLTDDCERAGFQFPLHEYVLVGTAPLFDFSIANHPLPQRSRQYNLSEG